MLPRLLSHQRRGSPRLIEDKIFRVSTSPSNRKLAQAFKYMRNTCPMTRPTFSFAHVLEGKKVLGVCHLTDFSELTSAEKKTNKSLMINKCFWSCLPHVTTEFFFYTKSFYAMDSPLRSH